MDEHALMFFARSGQTSACSLMSDTTRAGTIGNLSSQLVPLCLGQFIGGVVIVTLGPLLSPVMLDFGVPLAEAGLIPMGLFVGRAIGVLALMFLFARISLRLSLVAGYLLQAGALTATATLATNVAGFFAFYAVAGLALAVGLTVPECG